MIAALFIIYRIIVAVLALVVIWDIVRERSLAHVMSPVSYTHLTLPTKLEV